MILKEEYTWTASLVNLVAMLVSAQLCGSMFSLAPEFSSTRLALFPWHRGFRNGFDP